MVMDDNAARCVPQPRDAAPQLPAGLRRKVNEMPEREVMRDGRWLV
jgi:hypothetical protein